MLTFGLPGSACGGDEGDDAAAVDTTGVSSPLIEGARKAATSTDSPVTVVPNKQLGKTFYVLTFENHGTLPYVWGDLRETPEIPPDADSFSPRIERDGPIWRYAVSPGLGASIQFSTPLS